MKCNAMQCNAMQCNAMQCNAMQCNAMQCNAMQCNAMQCNAMQCNAMQCNAMQCNAMQCNAMQCNAMLLLAYVSQISRPCSRGEPGSRVLVQADNSFSARRRPVLWADIQYVVHCLLWGTTFTYRGVLEAPLQHGRAEPAYTRAKAVDAMQCNAMRCDAMRCDAMRCDAMRCDTMRCDSIQYNTIQYNTVYFQTQHNTINTELCHSMTDRLHVSGRGGGERKKNLYKSVPERCY